MDYSEIEAIIEEWCGPGQVLLIWEYRKGDQCALWLELYHGSCFGSTVVCDFASDVEVVVSFDAPPTRVENSLMSFPTFSPDFVAVSYAHCLDSALVCINVSNSLTSLPTLYPLDFSCS